MKEYLHTYLFKLSSSGVGLDFAKVTCRYGKFVIYCIIGPEDNIVHLSFASEKHERALEQLKSLNFKVYIKKIPQKKFHFDSMFTDYFSGRLTTFPIVNESPLVTAGTDFQKRIWRHIGEIPYGSCITYQQLAHSVGSPKGQRAAAKACGDNPVALIIPCHRIVAANGLGGFAGGVAIKEALLAMEHTGARLQK